MPEPAGHSMSTRLLWMPSSGSHRPSKAQANTVLPPRWRMEPRSMNGGLLAMPTSSLNSRQAASSALSPGSISPLGIVQMPWSRCGNQGPPGCAMNTSNAPSCKRYIRRPALTRDEGMARSWDPVGPSVGGSAPGRAPPPPMGCTLCHGVPRGNLPVDRFPRRAWPRASAITAFGRDVSRPSVRVRGPDRGP